MTRFANILETVGNTPVVRINKLGPNHVTLYVKIEAFNPLGSVKDRLARIPGVGRATQPFGTPTAGSSSRAFDTIGRSSRPSGSACTRTRPSSVIRTLASTRPPSSSTG